MEHTVSFKLKLKTHDKNKNGPTLTYMVIYTVVYYV